MTAYWLERAWTGSGPVRDGVLVDVVDGVFTRVTSAEPGDANRLAGLTVPGLANCHSHAFHRALRGRTQAERGTFWTWREQMYDVAARLTPDTYYELARAAYREMVTGGITTVGEFHYLHHGPDGTPYDDPNEMSHALVAAAREAGLRIALLDTCYLAAGIGLPPEGVQRRFSDGTAERWVQRVEEADLGPDVRLGAALHSVRAVPRDQMWHVTGWAGRTAAPLHVHLSEQVAENDACLAAYDMTPAELLEDVGALGRRSTAVHATHLTTDDTALLGASGTHACLCPTTERDLGDGIGPSRALHDAGSSLTLGTDSHAVVDLFEEMRAIELDERLATQERGHWSAVELLVAATATGHRSLGFERVGRIEVGARADLVTLDTASVRTAGTGADEATAVFAASTADVVHVVRDGVVVATDDDRRAAGAELDRVVRSLWEGR
ncbi:MAG TPA: formimidoylglutamate deiminase [Nocardioidaceae bacterium]|nr:formimidoylglutamate deiminase [Nocardioidaceae bacterium]